MQSKKCKFGKNVFFVEGNVVSSTFQRPLDIPPVISSNWLEGVLNNFEDGRHDVLVFPSSLSSHVGNRFASKVQDRHLCHTLAQQCTLYSKSFGARSEDRHLQIFKNERQRVQRHSPSHRHAGSGGLGVNSCWHVPYF
jgi:hypothetical protein